MPNPKQKITGKISNLTPEQEARLDAFREEWLAIGVCTDPADRPRAESAIDALYGKLDKKAPKFVWCLSPWAAQHEIHHRDPGPNLITLLWNTLGNHAKSPIHIAANNTMRENLSQPVWRIITALLENPIYDALGGSLVDVIEGQLDHDLEEHARGGKPPILSGNHASSWLWGQHEADWIAEMKYCDALGLNFDPDVRRIVARWEELVRSCMWWWAFEGLCFVCDRPEAVFWEAERPHCEHGPAVVFRDGWGAWAWKGFPVPREIIEQPVTLERIGSCENIEHRRILIDRHGLERYFEDSGAREVARDAQGVLLEMEIPGGEPQQIVRVENPTPGPGGERRAYLLPLEGRYKTPTDAIGSTFGIPPGSYKPTRQA